MDCNFAEVDPTLASDPRVILNLLALERSTMPPCDYFRNIQRDIQPFMRKVVTTWMLEVGIVMWFLKSLTFHFLSKNFFCLPLLKI